MSPSLQRRKTRAADRRLRQCEGTSGGAGQRFALGASSVDVRRGERFRPIPLQYEHLPLIEPWFNDAESVRWLGGRGRPATLLQLAHAHDRSVLLFQHDGLPAALLDLDRYGDGSAAIAIVVAPTQRRRGIARTILQSLFDLREANDVDEIIGEVERDNVAGERLLLAARFVLDTCTDEGFARYLLRRPDP